MIKQETSSGSPWYAGRSFMKTESGQLEFLGGDNDYLDLICLNGEIPTMSKRAVRNYKITEIEKRSTLDFLISKYKHSKPLPLHRRVWSHK